MRKKKTWLYILIAAVLFAVSSLLYVQSHPGAPSPAQGASLTNALKFKAAKEDLSNTVEVRGKSSYLNETLVYAPFSGDVTVWNVSDGMQVSQGSSLFKLDGKHLRQEIVQQEASLRKLELDAKLKNIQQAATDKSVQPMAVNESEALQRVAQSASKDIQSEIDSINRSISDAGLEEKRSKLAQADMNASVSGIFLFADAKQPQRVQENQLIGKIVDVSRLQMITSVGEYDVFRIQPGMTAKVKIDALKQTELSGKVEKVSKFPKPGSDNSAAQFEIVISLNAHESLIAGLSLTASIETDNKKGVLTVPTLAVQRDNTGYYVQLETAQGVERRPIKIGLETADKTEVLEGLQEGDTVVLQ